MQCGTMWYVKIVFRIFKYTGRVWLTNGVYEPTRRGPNRWCHKFNGTVQMYIGVYPASIRRAIHGTWYRSIVLIHDIMTAIPRRHEGCMKGFRVVSESCFARDRIPRRKVRRKREWTGECFAPGSKRIARSSWLDVSPGKCRETAKIVSDINYMSTPQSGVTKQIEVGGEE